jgi:hypothetical protein
MASWFTMRSDRKWQRSSLAMKILNRGGSDAKKGSKVCFRWHATGHKLHFCPAQNKAVEVENRFAFGLNASYGENLTPSRQQLLNVSGDSTEACSYCSYYRCSFFRIFPFGSMEIFKSSSSEERSIV